MSQLRIAKLRQQLKSEQMDAYIVHSLYNRQYLSGFTGSAGWLLITPDKAYLLTDFRYIEQATAEASNFQIIKHAPKILDTAKQLLDDHNLRRVGFEAEHLTFSEYETWKEALDQIELVPTGPIIEQIRQIKDDEELKIIKEATQLADQAFAHILPLIKPGVREIDLALELEWHMRRAGASAVSFDTIAASGARSALPHGAASEKKIETGDFITFDFGALYKGYCSDLTRTVVVGAPSDRHKEIYQIVLEAQLHTLAHLKAGMTGREADALARDIIAGYGYGEQFGHSTGHGLGMEVHENPRLSVQSETVLVPGMVVTVEPGIYLPGFGGVRIEDDVLITETGINILTSSPKELIIVG